MIGQQFGVFVIEAELGKGGMGAVYRARQTDLDRPVALKLLSKQLTDDAGFVERFRREARTVAQLNHPHIVQIYECSEQDGTYYYAMELVDGEDLDNRIRRKRRLEWKESVRIIGQICGGLDVAHKAGIIHRDLKPANILIDTAGKAKLMDFGIALDLDAERLTRTGGIIGTPAYMSPEQASAKTIGPGSDIYSLGIVFYEMLTGRVPFDNDNVMITLQQQRKDRPPPPRSLAEDIPVPIERIVMKMLEKDPAERYTSCGALVQDLRAVMKASAGKGAPTAAGTLSEGVTVAPTGVRRARRLRGTGLAGVENLRAGIERLGSAAVDTIAENRIILGGLAAIVIVGALVLFRDPCGRQLWKDPGREPGAIGWPVILSYASEMYIEKCRCYQDPLFADVAGPKMAVMLRNGSIITGTNGRMEADSVVISVPKVKGEVVLPANVLAENPLRPFTYTLYNQQAEGWTRTFYTKWRDDEGIRGDFRHSALKNMLKAGQPDVPAPPEVTARRHLKTLAKKHAALAAAKASGEDTAAAQQAYDVAVRAVVAGAKPHWL